MNKYSLVIRNGQIVDGSGAARYVADLGIAAGRIARIAPTGAIPSSEADESIDATGLIVAPGVIDLHTHYDAQIHWDPYCTTSSWHGTTSVVVGNCGFGFAPCPPELRERYMQMMVNTEQIAYNAMRATLPWNWVTYPEWMARLKQKTKGINIGSYLPLNSLMMFVMGADAAKTRAATAAERARMRALLHEAMDCGAIGFGFSHLGQMNSHKDFDGSPMPTDTMAVEEAYNLADVLRERGEGCIQALCELPGMPNRQVVEELARRSGRPVIHNVIAVLDLMPDFHTGVMQWLDSCVARGLDIYSQALSTRVWTEFRLLEYNAWDQVPVLAEFSNCGLSVADKLKKAGDADWRARLRSQYQPAMMVIAGGPFESFYLHDAKAAPAYEKFEGQLLGEIAAQLGVAVTDLIFDIGIASGMLADFRTSIATSQDPDKVAAMLLHPRVLIGTSDGGAHGKFYSGGHFSTDALTWLVREEKRIGLEAMHQKLSSLPARVLGLDRRGELREGWAADLMIYDYERLDYTRNRYLVAHDVPGDEWRRVVPVRGIDWVVVNGQAIFRNNNCQGAVPGQVLSLSRRAHARTTAVNV
ncbi:MAG: N-acyl-D-amino-acid deacylase family protein [Nevskiales bacterium]